MQVKRFCALFHVVLIDRHRPIYRRKPNDCRTSSELNTLAVLVEVLVRAFAPGAVEWRVAACLDEHAGCVVVRYLERERSICRFSIEPFSVPGSACELYGDRTILGAQLNVARPACIADGTVSNVCVDLA